MRTLIDFGKTPCIFEVTDEEFADWERRNAKEIERRRIKRGHDEAQALRNAERKGERRRDEHWQGVVAERDAALASKDARIAELEAMLGVRKLEAR